MKFPMNRALMRRDRKSERGVALAAFAIAMSGLLAFIPIAVDLGRLAHTANEVQTVADVAATAGATALLKGANARSQAQTVVAQNFVDGSAATISDAQVEVGQYNPQTRTFTNGALPANAVRATPSVTVQNLFAGIYGDGYRSSTVTKTATAGFSGLGEAAATLPLAIGACHFPELSSCFATDNCLPTLSQVPSTSDNTGFTSFLDSQAKAADYLPSECGGTKTPPVIHIGDQIALKNGQQNGNTLMDIEDCVEKKGFIKFLVPIVSTCDGNFVQSSPVTGFATIIVESVESQGGSKGLTLHAVFEDVQGPPGGGAYGTGKMRLYS